MSGRRGNVEAPPVWWGYCCRVGLSPVALRGLRGRWFCILSKSRTAAQHGGRFRLLSGGAGAGSLRDGLPWAVGRRVRHIMTWAGNLHRWPRRSSPSLSLLPSSGLSHGIAPGAGAGLDWIGCTVSGWWRGWSAGRGWRLVVWLGGAVAALAAACLLRSCSVVPALLLACLSACTGAGCSALPSGLAPAGLRRGAAVSGGQAGRWAGMIPLGWWAGGRRFPFVILHNFSPCISSLFTPLCQVSNS